MMLDPFCMVYYLKNAEMTAGLQDDLIHFSFDKLQNSFKNLHTQNFGENDNVFDFAPSFLECLKKLVCHHFCS